MNKQLPDGWVESSLGEIADWSSGGTPDTKNKEYYDGDIVWVVTGDLTDGYVRSSQKKITQAGLENSSAKVVQPGSVLIAMYGASIGRLGIADIACATNQAIAYTKHIYGSISNWFLFYYLQAKKEEFVGLGVGGAQPNISQTILKEFPILLPPLAEQARIVAALDGLLGRVRTAQEQLATVPKLLKRFRQGILSAAVSGKLTEDWREGNIDVKKVEKFLSEGNYILNEEYKELSEIPNSWRWVALGNYAKCSRGRFSARPRNDPQFFDGQYPFIQIGDLPREGGFVNEHKQTLNEKGLKISKMFPKNTIAIAIVGATIGNTGILSYDMCFPDSLVGVQTSSLDENLYVDFYFRNEKENIRQISYAGGGQPNIKLENLNDYPLPLPPLPEQKEIVRRASDLLTWVDKLEDGYKAAKRQLDAMPASILAKAFAGELTEQDPADEPASALLERIRAERLIETKRPKEKKNTTAEKPLKRRKTMAEQLRSIKEIMTATTAPMLAHTVWQQSVHRDDIEKFYAELKKLVDVEGSVVDVKEGDQSYLKLVNAD